MNIRTLREANRRLAVYVPPVAQLQGDNLTLERIRPLMALLGHPERRLRVVHIAGTSGKTSTAYYAAALLQAAGRRVGLTISPHIDSVTERVQLDGRPLAEAEFCELLGEFLDAISRAEQPPTYFELLYAFALWVFDKRGVNYAVVETGLGGRHDATNIVTRADKVCIITDIGLDHTDILGQTLGEITAQKIDIAHPGNAVFMYEQQSDEIMQVVRRAVADKSAELHLVSESEGGDEAADFRQRNWWLAYTAYQYLATRDDLPPLDTQALDRTQRIAIPARLEIHQFHGKTLIMDGAHNAQKMAGLLAALQQLYPGVRPAVLIGLKEGKDDEDVMALLAPAAGRVITTAFQTTQDLPVRSMDPHSLTATARAHGLTARAVPDQRLAFQELLGGPEPVCLITGSFYLLSQIRSNEHLA